MLKTITEYHLSEYYNSASSRKTLQDEMAYFFLPWFTIFGASLGAGAVIIMARAMYRALTEGLIVEPRYLIGFLLFIVGIILIAFLYWTGFIILWEHKNKGENAIKRFWKRYKRGKLPKLYAIAPYYENGTNYTLFRFHENCWHVSVMVLIPRDTCEKTIKLFDRAKKENYEVRKYGEKVQFIFKDEIIELNKEEFEGFLFISMLCKTQADRLERINKLLDLLVKGKITPYEYALMMEK